MHRWSHRVWNQPAINWTFCMGFGYVSASPGVDSDRPASRLSCSYALSNSPSPNKYWWRVAGQETEQSRTLNSLKVVYYYVMDPLKNNNTKLKPLSLILRLQVLDVFAPSEAWYDVHIQTPNMKTVVQLDRFCCLFGADYVTNIMITRRLTGCHHCHAAVCCILLYLSFCQCCEGKSIGSQFKT